MPADAIRYRHRGFLLTKHRFRGDDLPQDDLIAPTSSQPNTAECCEGIDILEPEADQEAGDKTHQATAQRASAHSDQHTRAVIAGLRFVQHCLHWSSHPFVFALLSRVGRNQPLPRVAPDSRNEPGRSQPRNHLHLTVTIDRDRHLENRLLQGNIERITRNGRPDDDIRRTTWPRWRIG